MKPNHKLVDIKKNSVTRGSNSKNKSSLQKNSPYGLIPTTGKIKHHKQLSSEENTFKNKRSFGIYNCILLYIIIFLIVFTNNDKNLLIVL